MSTKTIQNQINKNRLRYPEAIIKTKTAVLQVVEPAQNFITRRRNAWWVRVLQGRHKGYRKGEELVMIIGVRS